MLNNRCLIVKRIKIIKGMFTIKGRREYRDFERTQVELLSIGNVLFYFIFRGYTGIDLR